MTAPACVAWALCLLLACAVAWPQDALWEVRRAHVTDQTEEWTRMGRIPAWEVHIGPGEAPEIDITGDEVTGDFRGLVLVGRTWRVPDPLPAVLRFSVEYQTFCAIDRPDMQRSGIARLAFFTPERWERFAVDPTQAEIWDQRPDDEGALAVLPIHEQGRDVTEWRPWHSDNVSPILRNHAGQEIVLALVWGCFHFGIEEWGKFRGFDIQAMSEEELEWEFFHALDLDLPALAQVRQAVEAADLAGAREALARHIRTRQRPVGPPLSPDGSPRGIQAADEIARRIFRFVGTPPTQLEAPIRWNEDPHDYDQWPIALNRHFHWVTLGRAYAATGDEKYAREFVDQINGWIDAMPVYIGERWVQGPYAEGGKIPLTLDAGIRMAQTWWPAYYYFKDSPSFDVDSQVRMFRSFRDHAHYLMNPAHFRVTSNWGAMETAGLFHIGVMLPEFEQAAHWRDTAMERLVAAQEAQVYPDGAQIELAPGYHGVTLHNFLLSLDLADRNDIALPDEFIAGLERMFEYYLALAMPDGRLPDVNNSGRPHMGAMLSRGAELFPHRDDFLYLATDGREGTRPELTSWRLPYAGWNVMRTGWGPDDRYLFFENGPYGAGHQHEDKLNILLHAGGRVLLTEGGVYAYDGSVWQQYVLSTRAHNTVMVDGLEQNRRTRPDTYVVWEPEDTPWFTDDAFDFAEGYYQDGYGPDNAVDVKHTRAVLFAKPDYWLVLDSMQPTDDAEHLYEALFHLDAETASVDEATGSVTVEDERGAFRIIPFGDPLPQVRIAQGQTEPVVMGWRPTGRLGDLRPIPTAVFSWRAQGPTTVGFALVPRDAGHPWPVEGVHAQAAPAGNLFAQVSRPDGLRDVLVRRLPGLPAPPASLVETDAEVALVRLDARGRPTQLFLHGGETPKVRVRVKDAD